MTFYVENETEYTFPFSIEEAAERVIQMALETENCPYEAEVSVLITDNAAIRRLNREFRGIDRETDVLSFPNVDFRRPAGYEVLEEDGEADYFEPDSGELLLGDVILSYQKIVEQSGEYGHSLLREFSFLIAHSVLHLLGYDHMEPAEAKIMEEKQEVILAEIGITRDR